MHNSNFNSSVIVRAHAPRDAHACECAAYGEAGSGTKKIYVAAAGSNKKVKLCGRLGLHVKIVV